MTALSDVAEAALLDLLFLNIDFAGVGDAAGLQNSAAPGNFYLALHTADPGEAGSQTTSEASYGGYARVAIPRTSAGFSRSGSTISNAGVPTFNPATSSQTVTWASLGTDPTGTGKVLGKTQLTLPIPVAAPAQVYFPIGSLTFSFD